MLSYASVSDLEAYVQDVPPEILTLPDAGALERALERAERDVDRVAGPWPVYVSGKKFDPPALTAPQQDALKRATCAAAEFRLVQGEGELVGAEDGVASVGGLISFSRSPIPRLAPKLLEELAGVGLYLASGTLPVEDE